VLLSIALLVAIAIVVSITTPWPAALLIRALFEKGAQDTISEMRPYAPTSGVAEKLGVQYGHSGVDTTLDWFSPSDTTGPLPTVVWIHGGAWISGHKEDVDPYVRILASHGYTTVSLNYSIAPEATYPVALRQLNDALRFLSDNAAKYRIDPTRFVIAGDSAGSQLTSQLGTAITSPGYARKIGIVPGLARNQLSAVILDCGIYDVSGIPNAPGIGGWGFRTALWAYLGKKDWSHTPGGIEMSTLNYVTKDFPTTWISGGNDDPLTQSQSVRFANRLGDLGVQVTKVFYTKDHVPALPHEYQFHLRLKDARSALKSTIAFLGVVTSKH
jgi:acetyl esterase/lipase